MRPNAKIGALILAAALLAAALPLRASLPREWDSSRQDATPQSYVSHGGAETTETVPPSSLGVFAPLRETASRPDLTALQPIASQPSSDYYGYRYYDPSTTKWISKDPQGEAGGWNLTAFCANDPINNYDALGLEVHEYEDSDIDQYTPKGYWPYFYTDSWSPLEQIGVTFGNFGSLLANSIDLGLDNFGAFMDRNHVNEIGQTFYANGVPDPGDMLFSTAGFFAGMGRIARSAKQVEIAADLLPNMTKGRAWKELPGGVRIKQAGNYWIKEVNPNASKFAQWWGRGSLDAQAKALGKLDDMAPSYLYRNDKLITRDAGTYEPGHFWNTWWEGTKRLGTPMNDIRPRNIGENGIIFDPAFHPIQQGVYWTLGGVGSLWIGYGIYEVFGE